MFIREPFIGHFRSGDFDFIFVTIHLLYGDSKSHSRQELVLMDEVIAAVDEANGPEKDIILGGDFNFAADDHGWWCNPFKNGGKSSVIVLFKYSLTKRVSPFIVCIGNMVRT